MALAPTPELVNKMEGKPLPEAMTIEVNFKTVFKPADAVLFIKAKKNIFEYLFKPNAGPIQPVVTVPIEEQPQNPQLYRKISDKKWVPLPGSFSNGTLKVQVYHYGFYQVFSPIAGLPFSFGEVYVFPNPSKNGDVPTIHVEVGSADKVTARIYDSAGDLVFEKRIDENHVVINGKPAYEYGMEPSQFKSGVYNGVVTAEKGGKETIRKKFKFTVIR
jgi:hypothetical protein